jgi:hypothetical protein
VTKKKAVKKTSPEWRNYAERVGEAVRDHFSGIEHQMGGFFYRCVFISEDAILDTEISKRAPLNDKMYAVIWPLLFEGDKALDASGHAIETLSKICGKEALDSSVLGVCRYLARARSGEIMEAITK